MMEVIELVNMLRAMSTDTYQQCKYTMQAVSRDQKQVEDFVNALFAVADKRRPLPIGMKRMV